jgi:hypothetical protein
MIANVRRCDICGHDHDAANPVRATLTLTDVPPLEHPQGYYHYVGPTVPAESTEIHLCDLCGGHLVHLLRDHATARTAKAKRQPKPHPMTPGDVARVGRILGVKLE